MPGGPTFDDFIPQSEVVAEGVRELCEQLERNGWYPRKRWGPTGIAYWPDNQRPRMLVIELRYSPNEHKLDYYVGHTGLALTIRQEER